MWLTAYNTSWIQVRPDWEGLKRLPSGEVRLYASQERYHAHQDHSVHQDIDVHVGPYQFDGDTISIQVTSHNHGGLHIGPGTLMGEVCSSQGASDFGIFTLSPAEPNHSPETTNPETKSNLSEEEENLQHIIDCFAPEEFESPTLGWDDPWRCNPIYSPPGLEYLAKNILMEPKAPEQQEEPSSCITVPTTPPPRPISSLSNSTTEVNQPTFKPSLASRLYSMLCCALWWTRGEGWLVDGVS